MKEGVTMQGIWIGALLMLVSTVSNAAGIYKWVDANGNTQFSSTPPPKVAAQAEQVGNTGSARQSRRGKAVTGEWYGLVDYKPRRLTVSYDDEFYYGRGQHGGGAYEDYAKGRYSYASGELELVYQDESGTPVTERYRVIDLTDTQLTLVDARKQIIRYVREGNGDNSAERMVMSGEWLDESNNRLYSFGRASVEVRDVDSRRARIPLLHANYWVRGKGMTLEFIGDSSDKQRSSQRESWEVILLERTELRFRNAQGALVSLKRYSGG